MKKVLNKVIKKKYNNKEDVKRFVKEYESYDHFINVNNILQKSYAMLNPVLDEYLDFYSSEVHEKYKTKVLKELVSEYEGRALKEKFGKFDFVYIGSNSYENYILDYNGLTAVGPAKMSIEHDICRDLSDERFFEKVIDFEKQYNQMILDYIVSKENVKKSTKIHIEELIKLGIIDSGNKINYQIGHEIEIQKNFTTHKKRIGRP